jgi:hypothetical protein
MSFFSRFFGNKATPTTCGKETVVFDDNGAVRTRPDGGQEAIQWADLQEISIITTDEGPFVDDVFWALSGANSGCLVPSEAEGANELLAYMKNFPGFKYDVAIQAMGCAENARFVCWTKPDEVLPLESGLSPEQDN